MGYALQFLALMRQGNPKKDPLPGILLSFPRQVTTVRKVTEYPLRPPATSNTKLCLTASRTREHHPGAVLA